MPRTDAYSDPSGNTIAATLVENLDDIELIQIPTVLTDGGGVGDGTLFNLSQCPSEENIQPVDMENLPIAVEPEQNVNEQQTNQYPNGMELVHYRVELMDQFKMDAGQTNAMVQNPNDNDGAGVGTLGIEGIYEMDSDPSSNTNIVWSYLYPDVEMSIDDLPMEIMDTFERPLSSNGLLLTENGNSNIFDNDDNNDGLTEHERICRNLDSSQLDAYINWLSSVIETVNLALDFNGNGHPEPLVFSVPHVNFFGFFFAQNQFQST